MSGPVLLLEREREKTCSGVLGWTCLVLVCRAAASCRCRSLKMARIFGLDLKLIGCLAAALVRLDILSRDLLAQAC